MRIYVDVERCIGAGMCALTAPEVFDQNVEDGRVVLLRQLVDASSDAAASMAVSLCPSGAVYIDGPPRGGS